MRRNHHFKTNLGEISVNAISLIDDSIDISLEIEEVSPQIQIAINNGIEQAKEKTFAELKDEYTRRGYKWSKSGVKITSEYLWVRFNADKTMKTEVCVTFEDKENSHLYGGLDISVDLTAYRTELVKIIAKAVIDQYL